jgi:hypothetical protein
MLRVKYIIKEDVSDRPAFIPVEVSILRKLHDKHQELGTKEKMLEFLRKLMKFVGFSIDDALYYYYMFLANYREDKRYDLVTKADITPLTTLKSQKTPNYKMQTFIKPKLPFKGANTEGFWETDRNGENQYVVTSYNWYPILIFKNGTWYKVSESYSRSTGKHLSQSGVHPQRVGRTEIKRLTPNEMNQVRKGENLSDVENASMMREKTNIEEKLKGKNLRLNFDVPNLGLIGKVSYTVGDMNFDDKTFTIPIIIKSATLYGTQGVVSNVFGDNSEFKNVLEKSIKDNLNSKWGLWDKSKLHNREVVYQFDYSNLQ